MPDNRATQRQLITLAALTGNNWEDRNLTREEADELIVRYTETPPPNIAGENPDAPGQEPQEGSEPQQPAAQPVPQDGDDVLLAALRESVERVVREAGYDMERGTDAVDQKIREIVGVERNVVVLNQDSFRAENLTAIEFKNEHKNFPTLVHLLADRQHVMLIGPTGGGKTTAVMHATRALLDKDGNALKFFAKPCTMTDTSSDWFGYNSAHGYEPSLFRLAYEHGGVFVAEEIDAGNPSITTGMHMAVENGVGPFPDAMVPMHPDFRFVSTANTWGHGADRQYVGRNPLDAATIDRFWQMDWDYDEQLERVVAVELALAVSHEHEKMAHEWVSFVQQIRRRAFEAREQMVVSPRASMKGARALAVGSLEREAIENMLLWRNVKPNIRARLLQTGRA